MPTLLPKTPPMAALTGMLPESASPTKSPVTAELLCTIAVSAALDVTEAKSLIWPLTTKRLRPRASLRCARDLPSAHNP